MIICEVCGTDITRDPMRCTNRRCGPCHQKHCTPGGITYPGHGRGTVATPYANTGEPDRYLDAMVARERGLTPASNLPADTVSITRIYDLYWGERILTSVYGPVGLSDDEVRARALKSHEIAPRLSLDYNEAPFELELKIRRSEVRAR